MGKGNEPNLIWESDFGKDSEIIKIFLTITPELKQYSEFKISYDNTQPAQENAVPFIIKGKEKDNSFVQTNPYIIIKQNCTHIIFDLKSMPNCIPSKALSDFIFDEHECNNYNAGYYYYTFDGPLSRVGDQQKIMGRRLPRGYQYPAVYTSYLTFKENGLIVYSDPGGEMPEGTSNFMDVMNESIDRCAGYIRQHAPDVKYMRLIHTNGDFHNNRHPFVLQIWKDGKLTNILVFKPRNTSQDKAISTFLKRLHLPYCKVNSYKDGCGSSGMCEFIHILKKLPPNCKLSSRELATLLGRTVAALCMLNSQDLHSENFVLGINNLGVIGYYVIDGEAISLAPFRSVNEADTRGAPLSSYINLRQTFPTESGYSYINTLLDNLVSDSTPIIDLKQCFLTGFFDCVKLARDTIPKSQYEKLQRGITEQRIVPVSTSDLSKKLLVSPANMTHNNPVPHVFLLAIKIIDALKISTRDPALLSTPPLLSKLYINTENQVSLSIPTYCVKNEAIEVTWQQDTSGKYNEFCNFIQALVQTRSNHDIPKFNLNGNQIVMDSFIININQPEDWLISIQTQMYQKYLCDLAQLEETFNPTAESVCKTFENLSQPMECFSESTQRIAIALSLQKTIDSKKDTTVNVSNEELQNAQSGSPSERFSLKDEAFLTQLFGDNTAKTKTFVSELMTQTSSNKVHPSLPTAASAVKVQRTTPSATQGLQKNPSAIKH